MQIYIAAPYELRAQAIDVMQQLEAAGFMVTSSWLRQVGKEDETAARVDLADIDRADVLVLINPLEWIGRGTGGRHFESGYAYAKGKPIVLVGWPGNVFHQMSDVAFVHRDDLIETLRALEQDIAA